MRERGAGQRSRKAGVEFRTDRGLGLAGLDRWPNLFFSPTESVNYALATFSNNMSDSGHEFSPRPWRRRLYWAVAITVYWLCALWLLISVFPISFDGSGPTATFFWGSHPPTPTLADYDRNISIRLLFLYPYWFGASIVTILGGGLTTWLLRLGRPRRSLLFLVSSATTLFLFLMVGAISDAGIALHTWRGPTMYGGVSYVLPFLKVMVPMSLLAGILAVAR